MTRIKVLFGLGIVALAAAGVHYLGVPDLDRAAAALSPSSRASGATQMSNQILEPYEIAKNPYKYKGQSGILDTRNVPLEGRMGGGQRIMTPYPGGNLRFEKMISDHMAVYEVMFGGYAGITSGAEIAVKLPGNDPPEVNRPWRIYVEGSDDFENGFGATVQAAMIRFLGYYEPPPEPIETPAPAIQANPASPEGEPGAEKPDSGPTQPASVPSSAEGGGQ